MGFQWEEKLRWVFNGVSMGGGTAMGFKWVLNGRRNCDGFSMGFQWEDELQGAAGPRTVPPPPPPPSSHRTVRSAISPHRTVRSAGSDPASFFFFANFADEILLYGDEMV